MSSCPLRVGQCTPSTDSATSLVLPSSPKIDPKSPLRICKVKFQITSQLSGVVTDLQAGPIVEHSVYWVYPLIFQSALRRPNSESPLTRIRGFILCWKSHKTCHKGIVPIALALKLQGLGLESCTTQRTGHVRRCLKVTFCIQSIPVLMSRHTFMSCHVYLQLWIFQP